MATYLDYKKIAQNIAQQKAREGLSLQSGGSAAKTQQGFQYTPGNAAQAAQTAQPRAPFSYSPSFQAAKAEQPKNALTLQQDEEKVKRPYGNTYLDTLYQSAVKKLAQADVKQRAGLDPLGDARKLTDEYYSNLQAAVRLTENNKAGHDPMGAAQKIFDEGLESLLGRYETNGKSAEELRAGLDSLGYQSRAQINQGNQSRVISAAGMGGQTRESYDQLGRALEALLTGGPTAQVQRAIREQLEAIGDEGLLSAWRNAQGVSDLQYLRNLIAQRGQEAKSAAEVYQEADRAMSRANPLYTLARENKGKQEEMRDAFIRLEEIAAKAGGIEYNYTGPQDLDQLTEAERAVFEYAGDQDFDWDTALKNGELKAWGEAQAQALSQYDGMFSAYAPTALQQAYLDAYRKTPEGAKAWDEETVGTQENEQARENRWFVEREAKYNALKTRSDYAELARTSPFGENFNPQYEAMSHTIFSAVPLSGPEVATLAMLNAEDYGTFNAVWNTEGKEAAKEYLAYKKYETDAQAVSAAQNVFYGLGNNGVGGAILGSAVSVPASLARGVGAVDYWAQYLANTLGLRPYQPINTNTAAQNLGVISDAARQGVMDQVDWVVNVLGQDADLFDFVYGTAMSGVDSYAAGGVGRALGAMAGTANAAGNVAKWSGAAILGTGAAQSTMQDLQRRGVTDSQVALGGLLAGAAETFFEEFSIEKLITQGSALGEKTFKDRLRSVLQSMGTNFSEEFNTEVANILWDSVLLGENSEARQKEAQYRRLGLTETEARDQVFKEQIMQVTEAGLGGALMGAAFGAVGNVQSSQYTRQFDTRSGQAFQPATREQLWAIAQTQESGKAKELAKAVSADKATDRQAGQMWRYLSQEAGRAVSGVMRENVTADLEEYMGLLGAAGQGEAAQAITAMMSGENLNAEQVQAIAHSDAAMQLMNLFFGPQIEQRQEGQDPESQAEEEEDFAPIPESDALPAEIKTDKDAKQYQARKASAQTQAAAEAALDKYMRALYYQGPWSRSNKRQEALPKLTEALRAYREQGISLEEAFKAQGLQAPPEKLGAALSYAADELARISPREAPAPAPAEQKTAPAAEKPALDTGKEENQNERQAEEVAFGPEMREVKLPDALQNDADAKVYKNRMANAQTKAAAEAAMDKYLRTLYYNGPWSRSRNQDETLGKLRQALRDCREKGISLSTALEGQGLQAPPETMNTALAFAADELARISPNQQAQAGAEAPAQGTAGVEGEARQSAPKPALNGDERALEGESEATKPETPKPFAEVTGKEGKDKKSALGVNTKDGAVMVAFSDGTEAELEDSGLDAGHKAVAEAAADMDEEARQDMLAHYGGQADEQAGRDYAAGYGKVLEEARKGKSLEAVRSIFAETLTDEQRQAAWQTGRRAFERREAQAQERNREAARAAGFEALEQDTGDKAGLFFARVDKGLNDKKGKPSQKKMIQLKVIDQYARGKGFQVRVYDTLDNANGSYTTGTNIINLSLDADEGALTKTASHELYHFIEQWSKDEAQKIKDLAKGFLQKAEGYDWEARVKEIQERYKTQAGQELSSEEAENEIVADSMLDVIGTEANLKKLVRGDRTLAQKIADWARDTFNRLRALLARFDASSPEIRNLRQNADYINQLAERVEAALKTGAEAYQQARQGIPAPANQSAETKEYIQEMRDSTDEEDKAAALDNFVARLFLDAERGWLEKNADRYEEGLNELWQALKDYRENKISLDAALERHGLNAAPRSMARALSYAADQIMEAEKRGQAKSKRFSLEIKSADESEEYSLKNAPATQDQEDTDQSTRIDPALYSEIRQDEDARTALQMLRRLHELTTQGGEEAIIKPGTFEYRLSEIAQSILDKTGSAYSKRALMQALRRTYRAMEKPGYSMGETLAYMRQVAQRVLEAAPGTLVEQDETTQEILATLRNRPFYLSEDQKSEIRGTYGGLVDYTRKNFGRLKIRTEKNARASLYDVWQEDLAPRLPSVFAADTSEADMPGILDAWLENANEKKFAGEFGRNIGAYSTNLALDAMLDFYGVPGDLREAAEIKAEAEQKINDTISKTRREIREIEARARRLVEQSREEYAERYQQRVEVSQEKKKARQERDSVISEIRRNARTLNTRLMKGTDTRHIPEDLRGAIEQFANILYADRAVFSADEAKKYAYKYAQMAQDGALHDIDAAAAYDPDILEKLNYLAENIKEETPLRKMTMEQLQHINDIVGNIRAMVDQAEEIRVNGQKMKIDRMAGRMLNDFQAREAAAQNPAAEAVRKLRYKELTPYYFAKQIGGQLKALIEDAIHAQKEYIFTGKDAKAYAKEMVEKYNVNKWLYDDPLQMESEAGDKLELTKNEAMTLYAWWKREQTNAQQRANHLKLGGFVYDTADKDTRRKKGISLQKSHVLAQEDMNKITNYLGREGVEFIDKMVEYLSTTMAEKGNEASMAMFGWKKFGEKWYFPYTTDRSYRGQNSNTLGTGQDKQIKNMGASKALTEHAQNPLKLGNFTDLWLGHVDEMAMYSAFAEKLDNLRRVSNYVVEGEAGFDENGIGKIVPPTSLKKEMERAYGREAVQYLEEFIRDVNGGVTSDERGFGGKMISLFKKGSVAANLSVMFQQPSAFVRAMSMVSPKYFGKGLKMEGGYRATRARMYQYSGTANIKDMGRFDTSVGKSMVDWMGESIKAETRRERFLEGLDEAAGKGAEKADEMTWTYMYAAIEAEIADKTDLQRGTEAFNQAAAERFDEVMNATQVYDSTLAKSAWMRSTGFLDKMVTSFMSEPTLTFNMLMDAVTNVAEKKEGGKRFLLRTAAVFAAQAFVNALLKSIPTAFRRKKDEGRTYAEKYISEVAGNWADDVSLEGIAGMVPVARDAISLLQGYDVERADMTLAADLVSKYRKVEKDPDNAEAWKDLALSTLNIFGIPARNVYRDAEGIIKNLFMEGSKPLSETEWRDIWYSILDNTSLFSIVDFWDENTKAYYERMGQALLEGDQKKYKELYEYLTDTRQTKPDTADKGIQAVLQRYMEEGKAEESQVLNILKNQFGMDDKKAYSTVNKWTAKAENADNEGYSFNQYDKLGQAIDEGKSIPAAMREYIENGYTEKEVKAGLTAQYKARFVAGKVTQAQAIKALTQYDGMSADEAYWKVKEWEGGSDWKKYAAFEKAVETGKNLQATIKDYTSHGVEEKTLASQITATFKPQYVALYKKDKGKAADLKARLLAAYAALGYDREKKNKDIAKWLEEKK